MNIIYIPGSRAAEYTSEDLGDYTSSITTSYSASLYCGCPGEDKECCDYCYRNIGKQKKAIGGNKVRLKASAGTTPDEAYRHFIKEVWAIKPKIGDGYLLWTCTSDVGLPETVDLTWRCINYAVQIGIKCKVLSKMASYINHPLVIETMTKYPQMLKMGWTLTGHDEQERGLDSNLSRIEAMNTVHSVYGVPTWCSMEPMISIEGTKKMLEICIEKGCCDEYKIGILRGGNLQYSPAEIKAFKADVDAMGLKVYWKKSVVDFIK